jgi:hypothetical protein
MGQMRGLAEVPTEGVWLSAHLALWGLPGVLWQPRYACSTSQLTCSVQPWQVQCVWQAFHLSAMCHIIAMLWMCCGSKWHIPCLLSVWTWAAITGCAW